MNTPGLHNTNALLSAMRTAPMNDVGLHRVGTVTSADGTQQPSFAEMMQTALADPPRDLANSTAASNAGALNSSATLDALAGQAGMAVQGLRGMTNRTSEPSTPGSDRVRSDRSSDVGTAMRNESLQRDAAFTQGAAAGSGSMIYRDMRGEDASEQLLRRSAEELVSTAFLKPMFKLMRDDPLKSDLFGNSKGEETFGPMLDDEFARAIVSSEQWPIVDAVVRGLQVRGTGPSDHDAPRNPDRLPATTEVKHAV
ncbi:MAG: rod-binding protein [Planctomycetota bacterium]